MGSLARADPELHVASLTDHLSQGPRGISFPAQASRVQAQPGGNFSCLKGSSFPRNWPWASVSSRLGQPSLTALHLSWLPGAPFSQQAAAVGPRHRHVPASPQWLPSCNPSAGPGSRRPLSTEADLLSSSAPGLSVLAELMAFVTVERGTVMEIVLARSGGDGKHLVAQATDNLGRVGQGFM